MKKLLFLLAFLFAVGAAQAQFADQRQYVGQTSGTASAQVVAIPNYALNPGVVVRFIASFTNPSSLTLNVNATGAVPVMKQTPAGLVALVGGEVVVSQLSEVVFDGAQYELLNKSGSGFGGQVALASATVTDLGTVSTHDVFVTGTTSISSFGSSAVANNPYYFVEFAGHLSLLYSGSLVLPGAGSNIETSIGDQLLAQYLGGGTWQVIAYWASNAYQGAYPGEIRTFASANCPVNWQATDGTAVSRTADAGLFNAIGTTYGNGDGSTTFNVPDGRGYFNRVWANGSSRDSGRVLGSTQGNSVGVTSGTITGTATGSVSGATGSGNGTPVVGGGGSGGGWMISTSGSTLSPQTEGLPFSASLSGGAVTGTASVGTGSDTRPINIAYQQCIKL